MTRIRSISLLLVILFFVAATAVFPAAPQEISVKSELVEYTLPYPGILPDHPLFVLKSIRDNLWVFLSRGNQKKAELYLLFSDKRAAMAVSLSKKGKWEASATSLSIAEKQFRKILAVVDNSKKQGSGPPGDFIQTLKLSNAKHRQIIESLLKDAPTGNRTVVEAALKENTAIKDLLNRF